MTAPVSTATDFAIGVQSAKGSAQTALWTLRMKESTLLPIFDEANVGAEHGIANSSRPTLVKSTTRRTGYGASLMGSGFLYPNVLPLILVGLGFEDAVTDPTTTAWADSTAYEMGDLVTNSEVDYSCLVDHTSATATDAPGTGSAWETKWTTTVPYTHVLTIADRPDAAYLTAYQSIDEGDSQFERVATDVRFDQMSLIGNIQGSFVNFKGLGLDIVDGDSETFTDETNELIVATDGSLTAQISTTSLVSTIRGINLTVQNPLFTQEHRLFSPTRVDLPQLGLGVAGSMTGIDVDETLYNKLYRNSATGTTMSMVIPEMDLLFKFESVLAVGGMTSGTPYSVQFDLPTTSCRMQGYGASGRNLIRTALGFTMKDLVAATEPVTVTVVNSYGTSYHSS